MSLSAATGFDSISQALEHAPHRLLLHCNNLVPDTGDKHWHYAQPWFTAKARYSRIHEPDERPDYSVWLRKRGYVLDSKSNVSFLRRGFNRLLRLKARHRGEPWHHVETYQAHRATRLGDGAPVIILPRSRTLHRQELEATACFKEKRLASNLHNLAVPVFEALRIENDDENVLLVKPFLSPYNKPRFGTIGETLEFICQMLDGLVFAHDNNIALFSTLPKDIQMDTTSVQYPHFYDPSDPSHIRPRTRTERVPRYYIGDISEAYAVDASSRAKQESFMDPFATDVFQLGNFLKKEFTQTNKGFQFLSQLVNDMTNCEEMQRPTAKHAARRLVYIQRGLSERKLRSRVVPNNESAIIGVLRTGSHWIRRISYIFRRLPPMPVERC